MTIVTMLLRCQNGHGFGLFFAPTSPGTGFHTFLLDASEAGGAAVSIARSGPAPVDAVLHAGAEKWHAFAAMDTLFAARCLCERVRAVGGLHHYTRTEYADYVLGKFTALARDPAFSQATLTALYERAELSTLDICMIESMLLDMKITSDPAVEAAAIKILAEWGLVT